MRVVGANVYSLRIPFIEEFRHSTKARSFSDSFVVKLSSQDGAVGFGEGVARPYVTGETVARSLEHIKSVLWPAIERADYPDIIPSADPVAALAPVAQSLPDETEVDVIAYHAARGACEMAIIDLILRHQNLSLAVLLPPKRSTVIYSGVIGSYSLEETVRVAQRFKAMDISQVKIKIGQDGDKERVAIVREIFGPSVSIRVDANCAYDVDTAISVLNKLAEFGIDSAEQPIPRGDPDDLAQVKAESPIPVMVDESLVTIADATRLIDAGACDLFNLRLSKCGGVARVLEIAELASNAHLGIQLGCQVGETAILSAMGRHVAAFLDDLAFVEGSYGDLLLTEDLSTQSLAFGKGGVAGLLEGPGLGIDVCEDRLSKYALAVMRLGDS